MSNPLARRFQLDQALLVLLGLLVALPAIAVFVGIDDGKVVFLLYREPKLTVIMILGWVFLAAATCVLGSQSSGRLGRVGAVDRRASEHAD